MESPDEASRFMNLIEGSGDLSELEIDKEGEENEESADGKAKKGERKIEETVEL